MTRSIIKLVISGPSGVGKTTVALRVAALHNLDFAVSVTTRPKRSNEVDGTDYNFISSEAFNSMDKSGQLLERVRRFNNDYGIQKKFVVSRVSTVFTVDYNGMRKLRNFYHSIRIDAAIPTVSIGLILSY